MKKVIISIPIALFLVFWLIDYIPYGFKLMDEPGDPWYSAYTTTISLLLMVLFYPALAISDLMGFQHFGPGYKLATFIYAVIFSILIKIIWGYFDKKKTTEN